MYLLFNIATLVLFLHEQDKSSDIEQQPTSATTSKAIYYLKWGGGGGGYKINGIII